MVSKNGDITPPCTSLLHPRNCGVTFILDRICSPFVSKVICRPEWFSKPQPKQSLSKLGSCFHGVSVLFVIISFLMGLAQNSDYHQLFNNIYFPLFYLSIWDMSVVCSSGSNLDFLPRNLSQEVNNNITSWYYISAPSTNPFISGEVDIRTFSLLTIDICSTYVNKQCDSIYAEFLVVTEESEGIRIEIIVG